MLSASTLWKLKNHTLCIINSATRWEDQATSKSGQLTQWELSQCPTNGMLDGSRDRLEQIVQEKFLMLSGVNPRICNNLKWGSEIESPPALHYRGREKTQRKKIEFNFPHNKFTRHIIASASAAPWW